MGRRGCQLRRPVGDLPPNPGDRAGRKQQTARFPPLISGGTRNIVEMRTARKRKTDRRAAPATLTPEERSIFTLGKNAARFLARDRQARQLREQRNFLRGQADSAHGDDTPCYAISINSDSRYGPDDIDPEQEYGLPVSEWCDDCRRYDEARNAAVFAYLYRRSARQSLTAAYRRLLRLKQPEEGGFDT
jgi:hypothetical protein